MNIIGHGLDAVVVENIKAELEAPESFWTARVYSPAERAAADPPPMHVRYYAGRFAGKEAVAKALGTGFAGDITWRGIEILRRRDGSPRVRLSDGVLAFSKTRGITAWHISITYAGPLAIASVVATGPFTSP